MKIDSIKNGLVIDHISAGKAMYLYELLGLSKLDVSVAIIKNAPSKKMGKKDIITSNLFHSMKVFQAFLSLPPVGQKFINQRIKLSRMIHYF